MYNCQQDHNLHTEGSASHTSATRYWTLRHSSGTLLQAQSRQSLYWPNFEVFRERKWIRVSLEPTGLSRSSCGHCSEESWGTCHLLGLLRSTVPALLWLPKHWAESHMHHDLETSRRSAARWSLANLDVNCHCPSLQSLPGHDTCYGKCLPVQSVACKYRVSVSMPHLLSHLLEHPSNRETDWWGHLRGNLIKEFLKSEETLTF